MNALTLGFSLVKGAGRQGRIRLSLMALGAALGSMCLSGVLSLPHLLDARAVHVQQRTPYPARASAPGSTTRFRVIETNWGTRKLTEILLTAPPGSTPPNLPGATRMPAAGEILASPQIVAEARTHPALRERLPGTITGTISDDALAAPDELYAYIGVSKDAIGSADRLGGFGLPYKPQADLDAQTLHTTELMLGVFVLLPLGLFLATCNHLSAATRLRTLAALRLIGMPARQVRRINSVETACAAFIGSILGLLGYLVAERALARIGIPGLTWFAQDATPSTITTALCLIGLPAGAAWVARFGTAAAVESPIEVRRERPPKTPSPWRILPLAGGLAIMTGFWLGSADGHSAGPQSALLLVAGVLLSAYGVIAVYPLLARVLAGLAARNPRSTAVLLGARRGELEPGSAVRATAGLVLFVFATGLAHGFFRDWHAAVAAPQPVQQYSIQTDSAPEASQAKLRQLPGVTGAAMVVHTVLIPPSENGGRPMPVTTAFVGTCADLSRFVTAPPTNCVDGEPLAIEASQGVIGAPAVTPGTPLRFPLPEGEISIPMPQEQTAITLDVNSPAAGVSLLLPPSLLQGRQQADATWILISRPDAGSIESVLGGLARLAPAAEPDVIGIDTDGLREAELVDSLYTAGSALGIGLTLLAYLVGALDRATERRRNVTALTLLGVPRATLRWSQIVQAALFVTAGLLIALVAGVVTGQGYDGYGGLVRTLDWPAVGFTLIACCAVVAVGVLGSVPLLVRRIDPALIRRD